MTRTLDAHAAAPRTAHARSTKHHLGGALLWTALTACVAGGISWVSVDVLALSREQFLVPYALAGVTLSWMFVRSVGIDVAAAIKVNPLRTLAVTAITSAIMVETVVLQPGAPRAHGLRLAFELGWDGLAYGMIDGVLLTVVPITAVRAARASFWVDVLALLASVLVFVVYHAGFPEFRGTAMFAPVVAGMIFGTAYWVSRNPLAPVVAHAAMHLAAVLHGPAGTVQLPPHY